jgi:hypothetical protein
VPVAAREGDPPERVDVSGSWVHADVSSAVSGNGRYDFYVLNEVDLVGTEFRSAESGAGGSWVGVDAKVGGGDTDQTRGVEAGVAEESGESAAKADGPFILRVDHLHVEGVRPIHDREPGDADRCGGRPLCRVPRGRAGSGGTQSRFSDPDGRTLLRANLATDGFQRRSAPVGPPPRCFQRAAARSATSM